MNYLAHLYLAEPTPPSLIGNLIADFIKGRDLGYLPTGVERGVRQHRKVDSFTDSHPVVARSIGRISRRWGWYSGILIDMYYDHILATTWTDWSNEPLRDFVDRVHRTLVDHPHLIPDPSREMIGRLIETDRLWCYQTSEGIRDSLLHLSRRIRDRMPHRDVHLDEAMPLLAEHRDVLITDFREFFPDLIRSASVPAGQSI